MLHGWFYVHSKYGKGQGQGQGCKPVGLPTDKAVVVVWCLTQYTLCSVLLLAFHLLLTNCGLFAVFTLVSVLSLSFYIWNCFALFYMFTNSCQLTCSVADLGGARAPLPLISAEYLFSVYWLTQGFAFSALIWACSRAPPPFQKILDPPLMFTCQIGYAHVLSMYNYIDSILSVDVHV